MSSRRRCNECGAPLNGDSRELVSKYICLCGDCNTAPIEDILAEIGDDPMTDDGVTRRDLNDGVAKYSYRLSILDKEEGL